MTEANLQPLWPYYQSHKRVYTVFVVWQGLYTIPGEKITYIHLSSCTWCNLHQSHSSTRYVQLGKSQLYTYLGSEGRLVLPLPIAEFEEACMQFKEKTAVHLGTLYGLKTLCQTSERMLDTAFIGYY